jgi:hypothetical protein
MIIEAVLSPEQFDWLITNKMLAISALASLIVLMSLAYFWLYTKRRGIVFDITGPVRRDSNSQDFPIGSPVRAPAAQIFKARA